MFIKDSAGNWYEVDEKTLQDKKVDALKAQEAIVTERAEKRRKVVDLIATLDRDDIQMLREQLTIGMMPKNPFDCGGWGSECDCSDCAPNCDCSDCAPNCDCQNCAPNCDCQNCAPNCDCQNCAPNCDCNSSKVGGQNAGNWGAGRSYGNVNWRAGRVGTAAQRGAASRRFFR